MVDNSDESYNLFDPKNALSARTPKNLLYVK